MTRVAPGRGTVRTARITDLAALADLSRRSSDPRDGARSLGLPVAGMPISVFGLFALPLGAFQPSDRLYVHVDGGRVTGLARMEIGPRDEGTIVELDAVRAADSGDVRFRLVEHVLRDGARRGVARFHVACADAMDNVELFMQAGFMRYGEERILYRRPEAGTPAPSLDAARAAEAASSRIRPATPLDALAVARLYAAVTPQPVARLEAYALPDWESAVGHPRPRSSLAPLLRLSDLEAYVQEAPDGGPDGTRLDAFLQVGIARAAQPHYLRILALPGADVRGLVRFALGAVAHRSAAHRLEGLLGHRVDHGVLAPVRTYEAPLDRQLEDEGFEAIGTVTLLLNETLVRVAEPALVPAVR